MGSGSRGAGHKLGQPLEATTREIIVPGSQRHGTEVRRHPQTTLNLDWKQMGVGGDTSWGARTHPEYTLTEREYAYAFRLRPLTPKDDPAASARAMKADSGDR